MIEVKPTWAIVPAKSLVRGKSRLRAVLDEGARASFARQLLEHVLDVLRACEVDGVLDGVLVATDGDDVAELAHARGAQVLLDRADPRAGSLAAVVDRALQDVASRGAGGAVVVMADLPRIEPRDVAGLVSALDHGDVALVRDHLGRHTNALALAPPTAIATSFGSESSFARHRESARAAGLRVAIVENERIAFDVDGPADLERLTTPRRAGGTGSDRRA